MARDLSDPWAEIRALKERVRILETATPLQDASVTRGRLRVASADGFVAEAVAGGAPAVRVTGLQVVDGVLRITGTLEGSGTWSWTGPWTLSGNGTISGNVTATGTLTQNGPWNMNGAGTIAGNVTQTGNTTQQGNVNVTGGGKITVGSMVLDPTVRGGSIKFSGGPEVYASGSELSLYTGGSGSFISLDGSRGRLSGPGTKWIDITGGGFQFAGLPTRSSATSNNAPVGCVWSDPSGNFYRVV